MGCWSVKHKIDDHCWSYVYTEGFVVGNKRPLYLALDFSQQNMIKKKNFVEFFSEVNNHDLDL